MSNILRFSAPMTMRQGWLNWPVSARRMMAVTFWLFMNWLLLAPAKTFQEVQVLFVHQDKLAHLGIFGVLTGLVRWSIPSTWGMGYRRLLLIFTLFSYGVATELGQLLITSLGRNFEWIDLLMDFIGIILGVWLCERLALRETDARPPS